jgi:hypothetical protein
MFQTRHEKKETEEETTVVKKSPKSVFEGRQEAAVTISKERAFPSL